MKNLKALTLAALTAATAVTAPGVKAQVQAMPPQMGVNDFHYSVRPVVHTILKAGVPIYNVQNLPMCDTKADGSFMQGGYQPEHNVMIMCMNNISIMGAATTLVHEAVHLAQDCKTDGLAGPGIKPVLNDRQLESVAAKLSPRKVNTITKLYAEEDWKIEAEAFYFQDFPLKVNSTVKKYCF